MGGERLKRSETAWRTVLARGAHPPQQRELGTRRTTAVLRMQPKKHRATSTTPKTREKLWCTLRTPPQVHWQLTRRLEVEPSWVYGGFLERASPSESMRRIGSCVASALGAGLHGARKRAKNHPKTEKIIIFGHIAASYSHLTHRRPPVRPIALYQAVCSIARRACLPVPLREGFGACRG